MNSVKHITQTHIHILPGKGGLRLLISPFENIPDKKQ